MGVNVNLCPQGPSKPLGDELWPVCPVLAPPSLLADPLCLPWSRVPGKSPAWIGETQRGQRDLGCSGGSCSESRAGAQPSRSGRYGASGGSSSLAWAHVHAGRQATPQTLSAGNLVTKASQLNPPPSNPCHGDRFLPRTRHPPPPGAATGMSTGPKPGPSAPSLLLA